MDKNDIIEYVMTTPHNTNRAVLSSMLNQLTEGGGGSSDFSTATVTIVSSGAILSDFPTCASIMGREGVILQSLGDQASVIVPLWKGHLYFAPASEVTIESVSGDVAFIYNTVLDIYGDCTITIS